MSKQVNTKKTYYCLNCDFNSSDPNEQFTHMNLQPWHTLSDDKKYHNQTPDVCNVVSDEEIVKRLKETIEFLKVESMGGIWNTPQLIEMLEDHFKVNRRSKQ